MLYFIKICRRLPSDHYMVVDKETLDYFAKSSEEDGVFSYEVIHSGHIGICDTIIKKRMLDAVEDYFNV